MVNLPSSFPTEIRRPPIFGAQRSLPKLADVIDTRRSGPARTSAPAGEDNVLPSGSEYGADDDLLEAFNETDQRNGPAGHRVYTRSATGELELTPLRFELNIEKLRRCFGVEQPSGSDVPVGDPTGTDRPRVVLLGHNLKQDSEPLSQVLPNHKDTGCDFFGWIDTEKELSQAAKTIAIGASLPKLVTHYGIARKETRVYTKKGKDKIEHGFEGAHNAGNDAACNLRAQLRMMLDPTITYHGRSPSWAHIVNEMPSISLNITKPAPMPCDDKLVLLCIDCEFVEGTHGKNKVVTEYGISFIKVKDVMHTAPDVNGSGWDRHISDIHIRVQEYLHVRQRFHPRADPERFLWGNRLSEIVPKNDIPNHLFAFFERLANSFGTPVASVDDSTGATSATEAASLPAYPRTSPIPEAPTVPALEAMSAPMLTAPSAVPVHGNEEVMEVDEEDEDINDELEIIQQTCPHNLRGKPCNKSSWYCKEKLHACDLYRTGKCGFDTHHLRPITTTGANSQSVWNLPAAPVGDPTGAYAGTETSQELVYHIKPTCAALLKNEQCTHEPGFCGQDYIDIRIQIDQHRRTAGKWREAFEKWKGSDASSVPDELKSKSRLAKEKKQNAKKRKLEAGNDK
ncbi:MAG: hypothetical protein Q9181_000486 [Wetmoreana brouardii]